MTAAHAFTVFTPTYNRAALLPAVYTSLCEQTFTDFEWLIVDDGSEDDTRELVETWRHEGRLYIRYFWQPNQGKHVAHNRAVKEARGELFVVLDSDDRCTPQTLELFYRHWRAIPENRRSEFSGVNCLCRDTAGRIIGDRFPADVLDANPVQVYYRNGVTGEKWGCHRTELLREYPFPVFTGEKFVPEGLVWNRMGGRYLVRCVNEPLRIFESRSDGLSAQIRWLRHRNPRAMSLYYRELAVLPVGWGTRLKAVVNFGRTAPGARGSAAAAIAAAPFGFLGKMAAAAGTVIYFWERRRLR